MKYPSGLQNFKENPRVRKVFKTILLKPLLLKTIILKNRYASKKKSQLKQVVYFVVKKRIDSKL